MKGRWQSSCRMLFSVLIWAFVVTGASAQTLVVPRYLQTTEGGFNSIFPFSIGPYGYKSQRYQQVYAASEFQDVGGPVLITQIAFRPDGGWYSFDSVLPNVQVNLSTTMAGPDSLNPQFTANVGGDDTEVYSGELHLCSLFTQSQGGARDFDIQIPLTKPFLYDPAAGNLLLDIRNLGSGTLLVPFDSQAEPGDAISCVYSYGKDSVLDDEGFVGRNSFGLVTEFTFEPGDPPEPLLVAVDIKPQGCPNPWNVKSERILPVALLGATDLDVLMVDPASIRLAGVAPLRSAIEDVASPYGPALEQASVWDCTAGGSDGYKDLTLKFDSAEVAKAIQAELGRELVDGEALVLVLTGSLYEQAGSSHFRGEDVVLVLKGSKK